MSDKNRALGHFLKDHKDGRFPHVSATVVDRRFDTFYRPIVTIERTNFTMWYYVFDIYDNRNPYVMGPFREYEDAASGCRSHEKVVEHNQPYRLAELNAQYSG